MLRIKIAALKEGVHSFSMQPEPAELDLDPAQFADIELDVRLDYSGQRVYVAFEAKALATLECDRTLELFTTPVHGRYSMLFAPPDEGGGAEEQFDDVRVLMPSDQEIDIGDAVRDTLLLALPARRISPAAEKMDIPLSFGLPDDHIDPRWEALRKLRSEEPDD